MHISDASTPLAGGSPLIGVDVAVEEQIHSILVHEGLQLLPHLVVLLEGCVGGVQGVVVAGNHPADAQHGSRRGVIAEGEASLHMCHLHVTP